MHQGSDRRSDPGLEATPSPVVRPVALSRPQESGGVSLRVSELECEVDRLRQRCEELDGFVRAVVHDLRSPLSALDGFSTLLEESLRDLPLEQSSPARAWAGRVRAAAQQMGELIEGLQALAHLSNAPMQRAEVDLSAMARDILGRMAQLHPMPPLHMQVQDGLQCVGDPRLIRQLLENLLDNARKFSGRCERVHIEFGRLAQAEGSGAPAGAFFVRDRGAGFDAAQAHRLFQPYQRLHGQDEYAGLGLGLAIVKRIVARHGGQVLATAHEGQGATFYFTWSTDAQTSVAKGA